MTIVMPELHLYGVFLILSIFVGMGFVYVSLKDEIKKDKMILLFYLLYMVCALIFGKLYTAYAYPGISVLKAGLSAYGGLIGVVVAALIFEKIIPLNGKLIDASVVSLPLVYGLSKIACFVGGCCGGIEYDGFMSIRYPHVMDIPQFPVQLLEIVSGLIVFVVCFSLRGKKWVSYFTLIMVAVIKFLLDFLRYDHMEQTITSNQIFSIVLILIVIATYIISIYKKKRQVKAN